MKKWDILCHNYVNDICVILLLYMVEIERTLTNVKLNIYPSSSN